MPESTVKWQNFNQKKPYLVATVFSMVLVIAAVGLLFGKLAEGKQEAAAELDREIEPAKQRQQLLDRAMADLKKRQKESDQVTAWLDQRYYWADVMTEMRNVLVKVEAGMKNRFRTESGVWVEEFITATPRVEEATVAGGEAAPEETTRTSAEQLAAFRRRYGLDRSATPTPAPAPAATPGAEPGGGASVTRVRKPKGTNEISSVTVKFRAVGLSFVSPDANKEVFFSVLNEIKGSPVFDAEATEPDSKGISAEEPPGTFTFGIVVGLKRPLKL